jgi:hypothetical protein
MPGVGNNCVIYKMPENVSRKKKFEFGLIIVNSKNWFVIGVPMVNGEVTIDLESSEYVGAYANLMWRVMNDYYANRYFMLKDDYIDLSHSLIISAMNRALPPEKKIKELTQFVTASGAAEVKTRLMEAMVGNSDDESDEIGTILDGFLDQNSNWTVMTQQIYNMIAK